MNLGYFLTLFGALWIVFYYITNMGYVAIVVDHSVLAYYGESQPDAASIAQNEAERFGPQNAKYFTVGSMLAAMLVATFVTMVFAPKTLRRPKRSAIVEKFK